MSPSRTVAVALHGFVRNAAVSSPAGAPRQKASAATSVASSACGNPAMLARVYGVSTARMRSNSQFPPTWS